VVLVSAIVSAIAFGSAVAGSVCGSAMRSPRGPVRSTLGGPPRPAIRTLADGTPRGIENVRAPLWAALTLGRTSR
jgi:hypothetical protein